MRTPQVQEDFLQSGRFVESVRPRVWARRLLIGLLAVGVLCVIVLRLVSAFPRTVMREVRAGGDYVRYGVAVKQSRFGFGTFLGFWIEDARGVSEEVRLNTPRLRPTGVERPKWLANNQAVLLRMKEEVDLQSYTIPQECWILYNFKSGDLRTCTASDRDSCKELQELTRKIGEQQ